MTSQGSLISFVRESNAIEGIHRDPLDREIAAHEHFLALDEVRVEDLENFEAYLSELLAAIHSFEMTPWSAHVEYETLHPWTDGNGRSGRVLWAWQMAQEGKDPFAMSFLRRSYYDALEASR